MIRTLFFCLSSLILISPSWAQDQKHIRMSFDETYEKANFINGNDNDKAFKVVLNVELDEGWHTYYVEPGDTGLPPRFNWDASTNFKSASINYPEPIKMDEQGLKVNGYKDHISFPTFIWLEEEGKPAKLDLTADFLICNKICIPETLHATLEIQP